jgi:hypothetical protein
MDKAEFTNRLFERLKGRLSATERNAAKEIEGRKSRTDADTFKEWLKTEHEKAASSPALVAYDRVSRLTMNTPEGAATSLADFINFDLDGQVDWRQEWNNALPILTNWKPERSNDWNYKSNLLTYLKGSEADIRARVFARFMEIENGGFGIDIPSLISQVLENYPKIAVLKLNLEEEITIQHGKALETARALGREGLKTAILSKYKGIDTYFLSGLGYDEENAIGQEIKARAEINKRFWDAVLERLTEKQEIEDPHPLLPFFHNEEKIDLALHAAKETGLINAEGTWAHIGEKTHAISVFWRAAVTAGAAKADAPIYKVTSALSEQFGNKFGQNAINKKKEIADFGETYKELYKALLAIMRP